MEQQEIGHRAIVLIDNLKQNFLRGDAMNPETCLQDVDTLSTLGSTEVPEVRNLLRKFSHHPKVYNAVLDHLKAASGANDLAGLEGNLRLADLVGMREVEGLISLFAKLEGQLKTLKPQSMEEKKPFEQATSVTYPEGITIGEQIYPSAETGRLTIVRLLSDRGATTCIFEAKRLDGSLIVIKALRKEYLPPSGREIADRLRMEFAVLQKLHARGARVPRPIYYDEQTHWLFMEKAPGKSIFQHMQDENNPLAKYGPGRLEEELGLRLAVPILSTIKEAHNIGITHNDYDNDDLFWNDSVTNYRPGKPIDPSSVTVIDWNVADSIGSKPHATIEKDLQRFSGNLAEFLTGISIIYGHTLEEVLETDAWNSFSPETQTLLLRGLDETRPDRWHSADEMIAEIHRILAKKIPNGTAEPLKPHRVQ